MNVLVSGATGLVGSALAKALHAAGHQVGRMVRAPRRPGRNDVRWDPAESWIDRQAMEARDAVVHLAGASIAKRWSARRRRLIRQTRVECTRILCEALTNLDVPPPVLACASAVGYYGDRGGEVLTEDAPAGAGFLAEVCREWEAATTAAAKHGIRVVILRFGMILSARGGALRRMLLPFRLCLGGRTGSGNQYWPWIALDDAVSAIVHCLTNERLRGPVNVVAPQQVTNREFARALGKALYRPAWLPTPGGMAWLLFGRMAGELLLASARAEPRKLIRSGFAFRYPELNAALRHVLA